MSDKAKEFFDNYDFSETINKDDLVISETDIIELMQSYAHQHLKDVLEQYQHYIDWNEEHDRNSSKQEKMDSFLNHLKQKIKSKH